MFIMDGDHTFKSALMARTTPIKDEANVMEGASHGHDSAQHIETGSMEYTAQTITSHQGSSIPSR